MRKRTLLFAAIGALLVVNSARAWDFTYGYRNVFDANADTYIVGTENVRKYSEWQNPPVTYWAPSANDVQGLLTSRFNFSVPISQAHLDATILSINWGSRGDYGSSSLWGSTDGVNWQLLLSNPTPPASGYDSVASTGHYDQDLPSSLLGASSLWLQVRMQVHGCLVTASDPRATWADAQFSRVDPNVGNLFQLDVALVPEPGTLQLAASGAIALLAFRARKRAQSL